MVSINKTTYGFLSASPEFPRLLSEYANESAIEGLPYPAHSPEIYRALENSGAFHFYGAFDGAALIGFGAMCITRNPHYNKLIATIESIFVSPLHRVFGAGVKLIRAMEAHAKEAGAIGIFGSAPAESFRVNSFYSSRGYRETNSTYFKGF